MNTLSKALSLKPRTIGTSVRGLRPRLLLVTSGSRSNREAVSNALTIAARLVDDGWTARAVTGENDTRNPCLQPSDLECTTHLLSHIRNVVRLMPSYDIVHLITGASGSFWYFVVPVLLLSRFLGKPVVLNSAPFISEDFLGRWGWLAGPLLRLADRILVDCDSLAETFEQHRLEVEVSVMPLDSPRECSDRSGRLQPKILLDRPLESWSNIGCMLRAFKFIKQKYPRAELLITGDGSQLRVLKEQVQAESVQGVSFPTNSTHAHLDGLYCEADLYVNSSSQDAALGSVLRAFAAGLPVVTTEAEGVTQVVKNRVNGLVVQVNDHVALAERVFELIENPELVTQLTRHARSDAQLCSWEHVGQWWKQTYRAVAASQDYHSEKVSI